MQLMTWMVARLGSRFSLLFEPHQRRIRHSALGRFFDQPMDLMVGLVEPDGTERVLPFTTRGQPLYNPEQFERLNSVTFRGYSTHYGLKFELNVHSVFYPQDEPLCLMPVFYLEMRISPTGRIRGTDPIAPTPSSVKLFIRLNRPDTQITATAQATRGDAGDTESWIDLAYHNTLIPSHSHTFAPITPDGGDLTVPVHERIVSLNPGCAVEDDGKGLSLELPVTEMGSGIKWRLVWGAHCSQPVFRGSGPGQPPAPLRYNRHWADLDAVMQEAIRLRDDRLAHSRRFEKLVDQAPLSMAQRHLLNQGFQTFLANTCWCAPDDTTQWFGVWEGYRSSGSLTDPAYYSALWSLAVWPHLLAMQLEQWTGHERVHTPSSGGYLALEPESQAPEAQRGDAPALEDRPVEDNCNYLLLMQAYTRWTGDRSIAQRHADLVTRLASFLIWSDRESSGFPCEGSVPDEAQGAARDPQQPTYLAIKRLCALQAASDLLSDESNEGSRRYQQLVEADAATVELQAWHGDHYTHCVDQAMLGIQEAWAGDTVSSDAGAAQGDVYTIDTGNGLLLPVMTAQPLLLDPHRVETDLVNAARETLSAYGCGADSARIETVIISKNLWRDHLAEYLGCGRTTRSQRYWDLQVMSNTDQQSLGYCDSYIGYHLPFSPRGAACIGFLLAGPRLVINRLAPGGSLISVEPRRDGAQRWPLLPLADWKAGKIPVCVVASNGNIAIEGESDPIIVHGGQSTTAQVIG